ncbi:hypothetical protein NHX12_004342 [Muraenolepis orangiensis]|uniref:Secreted protein n=1 Tax=Muraenolepis orangiensis TaxID=630683 RepID=A0A9Q0DYV0_9TELE|nr:hypothetical protein NHX12_004342 [Muraenolepis orangiensis]
MELAVQTGRSMALLTAPRCLWFFALAVCQPVTGRWTAEHNRIPGHRRQDSDSLIMAKVAPGVGREDSVAVVLVFDPDQRLAEVTRGGGSRASVEHGVS